MLPSNGELSPTKARNALADRLRDLGIVDSPLSANIDQAQKREARVAELAVGKTIRPAFFCSGCPHNTSTLVPEGSAAMSGVGCHGLAAYTMPERRTMLPMPMGGEGMPWVAAATFVDTAHMFQNMGDGTYAHSGLLAIRASVAANWVQSFS